MTPRCHHRPEVTTLLTECQNKGEHNQKKMAQSSIQHYKTSQCMASSKSDQVCKNIEIHGSYQETVNKQRQNQKGQKLEHKDFKTAIINMLAAATAKSLQSCPTLCDPIDGGPPGSPVPGILQARTLEWVAISFSNA